MLSFGDLIDIPKCIHPTVPGGCGQGHGCGHGGQLPNQLFMSAETVWYIEEAEECTQKKDKLKQEKDEFVKKALADKSKKDRQMEKKTK